MNVFDDLRILGLVEEGQILYFKLVKGRVELKGRCNLAYYNEHVKPKIGDEIEVATKYLDELYKFRISDKIDELLEEKEKPKLFNLFKMINSALPGLDLLTHSYSYYIDMNSYIDKSEMMQDLIVECLG